MFASYDQMVQNFHKGFKTKPQSETEDPTYLGFKFIFDFDPTHRDPQDKMTHDALFADRDNEHGLESAERYLIDIGYPEKSRMIRAFRKNLEYINSVTPYYFQSIEGVMDLWKVDKSEAFNSFRGKDKILTINCLESIDMRITSLADLYRKGSFDYNAMRELLPENLRHFTMILQIAEMRSFHRIKQTLSEAEAAVAQANGGDIQQQQQVRFESINDLISVIQFKLEYCEFDFEDSWPAENISHAEMEMAKQKFKIKVGRMREYNQYTQLKDFKGVATLVDSYGVNDRSQVNLMGGDITEDSSSIFNSLGQNELGSAYNNISRYGQIGTVVGGAVSDLQKRLERAPGDLVARGVNAVQSAATGLVLGNVYGDLRNQTLGTVLNGFLNQADQVATFTGGDVYPNVPEPPKKYPDTLGNAFKG